MVRRSTGALFGQVIDPFVEFGIALHADGATPALGFQQVKQRRDGEGRIGPEPPPFDRGPGGGGTARRNRLQHILPTIGAVDIAGPQSAPFQIAELVEHEKRVQVLLLEMTIPCRPFLIAMHRAFRTVHVQSDDLRRALVVHGVNPAPRRIDQHREVLRPGQHLGLEPAHGTRGGCARLHRTSADNLPHHRIAAQPVGVIDVLISGQARENRLAQEAREAVPSVLASANISKQTRRHVRQAKNIVQFAVQQQSAIRTDRRTPELNLDRAVKFQPKRPRFRFTRRVPRQAPTPSSLRC